MVVGLAGNRNGLNAPFQGFVFAVTWVCPTNTTTENPTNATATFLISFRATVTFARCVCLGVCLGVCSSVCWSVCLGGLVLERVGVFIFHSNIISNTYHHHHHKHNTKQQCLPRFPRRARRRQARPRPPPGTGPAARSARSPLASTSTRC